MVNRDRVVIVDSGEHMVVGADCFLLFFTERDVPSVLSFELLHSKVRELVEGDSMSEGFLLFLDPV